MFLHLEVARVGQEAFVFRNAKLSYYGIIFPCLYVFPIESWLFKEVYNRDHRVPLINLSFSKITHVSTGRSPSFHICLL
jgi:hypothetical protein